MKVTRVVWVFFSFSFYFQSHHVLYAADKPSVFQMGGFDLNTDILQLKDAYPNSSHTLVEGTYTENRRVFLKYPESLGNGKVNPGFEDGALRKVESGQYELRAYGNDVKAHVFLADFEIRNGRIQVVRLNFEKPETDMAGHPQEGSRYPACQLIVKELISKYGQPTRQNTRQEEAATMKTIRWVTSHSELSLDCFQQKGEPYQAYRAEISRKSK